MSKNIIIIPIYNDWKSLNKLLFQLNENLKNNKNFETEILIINDYSSEKINIKKDNLSSIKKISIINLNKNLGSQKAIAVGLFYLKDRAKNSFVTIMDGDGEDDPLQVNNMLEEAKKNQDFIITSNRKKRQESLAIQILYKIHLIMTFIFSHKWISFGNFTTFSSKNISKILSNNNSWYAHSSSVLNNCKIKRLYAKREKRYFDKSKINFLALVEHSLRVIGVFYNTVFLMSGIYLILFWFLPFKFSNLICLFIIIFNFLLIIIKIKHFKKEEINYINFKKSIEII